VAASFSFDKIYNFEGLTFCFFDSLFLLFCSAPPFSCFYFSFSSAFSSFSFCLAAFFASFANFY